MNPPDQHEPDTHQALFKLLQAYRSTSYVVTTKPPVALRIGQGVQWPQGHPLATSHWCWITADNPGSQLREANINAMAQYALGQHLQQQYLLHWSCTARDDAGVWPEEQGYVIALADRTTALCWARQACDQWQQLGVLLGEPGHAVQLMLWGDHPIFTRIHKTEGSGSPELLRQALQAMKIVLL